MSRESIIEKQARLWVEERNGRLPKWTSPGNLGVPDRILFYPGLPICVIEFKRERGGKYSPMQDEWDTWLVRRGFHAFRVESFKEFLDLMGQLKLENGLT